LYRLIQLPSLFAAAIAAAAITTAAIAAAASNYFPQF